VARLIDESFRLRRLGRRVGWRYRALRPEAPQRPVAVKLELTHACNLRCGFCYTDSPRHTLSRTPDLPDEAWLGIADQAADLGVQEVVLSGGEPLLRRELVLDLAERLARRGVRPTLNTNGWFVDDAVADRLAGVDGLRADISIDGATAALHDAARGVPGSWRRAVRATARLLDRSVRVRVVHVLTPGNARALPDFLDQMWVLGVDCVQATPVVEIGAAARGGRWHVDRGGLRRAIRRFRAHHGEDMRIVLQPGNAGVLAINDQAAPMAMLVRPSGLVLTDSLHPFAFGHAVEDGLAQCWRRIAAGWRHPRISAWAGALRSHRDIPRSGVVPYLDEEVPVAGPERDGGRLRTRHHADDPVPIPSRRGDGTGDPVEGLARDRAEIRELAMTRRYRLRALRTTGGEDGRLTLVTPDGGIMRLNRTAALLLDALDGGTPTDAVERLAGRFGEGDRGRLEQDVLATGRSLTRRGVLVPAGPLRSGAR
jgi:MoaA/NifB/PqqE/SkfB family radical SAM enzyme